MVIKYLKNWLKNQPKNEAGSEIVVKNGRVISGGVSPGRTLDQVKPIETMVKKDLYIEYLDSMSKLQNTKDTYKYGYKFWQSVTSKRIENLKENEIQSLIVLLDKNTAKNRLSCLRNYAKFCLKNGNEKLFLELQKLDRIGSKKRIPKHKSRDEFIGLTAKAKEMISRNDRRGLWLAMMLDCGLRISEIENAQRGSDYIQVIGKGDKERRIPAPPYVLKGMHEIQQGRGGWRKSRNIVSQELRKIDVTHPHSLRHTYATMLLREGLTIQQIQQLLGHESIATTQIYAKTQLPGNVIEILESIK